jgi:SSS family solute:Na+ symporter
MTSNFSGPDWAFIILFLIAVGWVCVLARRYGSSLADFLVAGRSLGILRGIATLSSTEWGLITIMYMAEESYLNGFVAISVGVIAAVTMAFVGMTGFIVHKLRDYKAVTTPEFLGRRFHPNIRFISGLLSFMAGVLNMGIFVQVEGIFLVTVMGLPPASLHLVMAVLLLVVLIYTIIGGMHSVVLTDIVQFVLIALAVSFVTVFAIGQAGWWNMVETVSLNYGRGGFLPFAAPRYGLLFITWTTLYYLSGWTTWQPVAMRIFSMKSSTVGDRLYATSAVLFFCRALFPMLWGIAALTIVGIINTSSTALPTMLVRILPAGFIGLATIGFLAASMSTYDSYLLAFSSVLVRDVISRFRRKEFDERNSIRMTRMGILALGLFIFFWGSFYHFSESIYRYIVISGTLAFAGNFVTLASGLYWRKASTLGAYLAFAGSMLPGAACLIFPSIDSTIAGLLCYSLAAVGMLAGSLLFPGRENNGLIKTSVASV